MKNAIIRYLAIPTIFFSMGAIANAASSEKGYAFDNQSVVVKDNYGDCVRTTYQDKETPPACGGEVAVTKPPVRVERAMPAPIPAPVPVSKTVLEGKALFDTGRSVLRPAGRASVDKFARDIKSIPNVQKIHVIGYTDSSGSATKNQALSGQRALSVKHYLEGKGLSNISSEGRGDRDPVATNATADGRAKNRRVEIEVMSR